MSESRSPRAPFVDRMKDLQQGYAEFPASGYEGRDFSILGLRYKSREIRPCTVSVIVILFISRLLISISEYHPPDAFGHSVAMQTYFRLF